MFFFLLIYPIALLYLAVAFHLLVSHPLNFFPIAFVFRISCVILSFSIFSTCSSHLHLCIIINIIMFSYLCIVSIFSFIFCAIHFPYSHYTNDFPHFPITMFFSRPMVRYVIIGLVTVLIHVFLCFSLTFVSFRTCNFLSLIFYFSFHPL